MSFHLFLLLIGGEDNLALKIEAIIDADNDVCLKSESETQERTRQHFEDQGSPQYRRKRLSEAVLSLRNSCQASAVFKVLYIPI